MTERQRIDRTANKAITDRSRGEEKKELNYGNEHHLNNHLGSLHRLQGLDTWTTWKLFQRPGTIENNMLMAENLL